jgi:hypothetical protein
MVNDSQELPVLDVKKAVILIAVVVLVVAFQLYQTASATGNFEGMWFSLVHTLLVAAGTWCALGLRKRR